MMTAGVAVPIEALATLRRRLAALPGRHPQRDMPAAEIERWCEIIATMKVRTTNRKGRHLSTVRILRLLVEHGAETPDGLQRLAPGRLTASTINRHMSRLGYDRDRMTRQPPAVRFQAEQSNALWHFGIARPT